MRRLALIVCLLIGTVAAHAQFEKGKWFVNPSVTGLNFSYNTETDKAHFGLEVKGGAFLIDNVALLLDAGATWQGGGTDVYTLGVGGRYYFNKIGVFLGADVNLNRYNLNFQNTNLVEGMYGHGGRLCFLPVAYGHYRACRLLGYK